MKVFLLQDIKGVGMANEIVDVKEGYADNFLIPKKMGVRITPANEALYSAKVKKIENRKEVIASKTSMLAEKIKGIKLTVKRKMHDDGKLYAAISAAEIADLLTKEGVVVAKNQVKLDKSIKEKGTFAVTVKLTSQLMPVLQIKVVAESSSLS